MNKNICVYCSSSNNLETKYYKVAEELGTLIAKNNCQLIYGGTTVGLMGTVSTFAKRNGAKVVSVVPETIKNFGIANTDCEQFIVTNTMHERKKVMEDLADAFIILPGGFGTLEELTEVITLKQLSYHKKAIIILNSFNFFDTLFIFFEKFYNENFAKLDFKNAYEIVDTPDKAISYIKTYKFSSFTNKCY